MNREIIYDEEVKKFPEALKNGDYLLDVYRGFALGIDKRGAFLQPVWVNEKGEPKK